MILFINELPPDFAFGFALFGRLALVVFFLASDNGNIQLDFLGLIIYRNRHNCQAFGFLGFFQVEYFVFMKQELAVAVWGRFAVSAVGFAGLGRQRRLRRREGRTARG